MLSPAGLAAAAEAYRGTLSATDPLVSPVRGDLRGLGRITLLCGTRDILVADARRLAGRAEEAGLTLDYYEAPGMLHVYPLLPIREGKEARALIAGAVGRY
jgi:acetyl esterase/lipase